MNKGYVMPSKDLLIKNSERDDLDDRYYRLSKLLFKKDLNDKLLVPIGIDDKREKYFVNLNDISLMLIGGETGSGKSVLIDSIIVSLLLKNSPDDLRFVFIDPKKIELFEYDGIPHIIDGGFDTDEISHIVDSKFDNDELSRIIDGGFDTDKISHIIDNGFDTEDWKRKIVLIKEMIDKRIELLSGVRVSNIRKYNDISNDKLAQVVIVIDEAYDMIHDKEFIELVRCIGSVGVNIGVHLIMSTNMCVKSEFDKELFSLFGYVLTFDLSNSEQSRYMNLKGAEFLKVCGEAMIKVRGEGVVRIQAPYVSDKEIKNVVEFIKNENDAVNV